MKNEATEQPTNSFLLSPNRIIIGAIAAAIIVATVLFLLLGSNFTHNSRRIEQATNSVVTVSCYDKFGDLNATVNGFVFLMIQQSPPIFMK